MLTTQIYLTAQILKKNFITAKILSDSAGLRIQQAQLKSLKEFYSSRIFF
jgi:hypothetical protein